MLLRLLRDTDYRAAKDVVRERFHIDELRTFAGIWKIRNRDASVCIVHQTCLLGLIVVVQNKIEYVAVHERFGSMGLGGLLVCAVLEILQDDFRIAHLVTADNPMLRQWYQKFGFDCASTATCRKNMVGWELMIYRFRTKRKREIRATNVHTHGSAMRAAPLEALATTCTSTTATTATAP